jgi:hypothetical protein
LVGRKKPFASRKLLFVIHELRKAMRRKTRKKVKGDILLADDAKHDF